MDLKQGDLENIILNALWDLEGQGNEKIFVGDIQDKIKSSGKKWAYTTVKTVLDRLVDKEIAIREKDGKKYFYRSILDRDQAGLVALRKVARQYFRNDLDELINCLLQMRPGQEGRTCANGQEGRVRGGDGQAECFSPRESEDECKFAGDMERESLYSSSTP
jgi:predicted transcriptional regulator